MAPADFSHSIFNHYVSLHHASFLMVGKEPDIVFTSYLVVRSSSVELKM